MRISVVIATLNRPRLLDETLSSIEGLRRLPEQVVVVDGDPGRSAAPVVAARQGPTAIAYEYVESGRGLTLQRNVGLAHCDGDVVVFLDDDTELHSAAFDELLFAYADADVVGVTGRVTQPSQHRVDRESPLRRLLPGGGRDGSFTRYGYPRYIRNVDHQHDVEFMPGCFMSARREAAVLIGFDEQIAGSGLGEDEDFSCRLGRLGRLVYVPDARLHHKLAPSGDDDSRYAARVTVINRAYLFRKNFTRTPLARVQFGWLMLALLGHRALNGDAAAMRGVLEGVASVLRGRGLPVSQAAVPVVFVGSHARRGGSERYLEHVVTAVDADLRRGVVLLEDGPSVTALRTAGHRVDVIPTGRTAPALAVASWRLRRLLVRAHPTVVHANGVKAALAAVLATRATGIRVVWVKHDYAFDGIVGRFVARRCALVIGVSSPVVESVLGVAPGRARVVNIGIPRLAADREAGRRSLVAAFPVDDPHLIVGLVARLERGKGHDEVLALVPRLLARRPGLRVAFVGAEDAAAAGYEAELRERVGSLGLEDTVAFLGHRGDAADLIAGLDVLVLPSLAADGSHRAEGFPLVALEALQLGTPIVCYGTGGVPELVGDAARVVAPGDREALARELELVLDDAELRASLAARGRVRSEARYQVEPMLAALRACYAEAARA